MAIELLLGTFALVPPQFFLLQRSSKVRIHSICDLGQKIAKDLIHIFGGGVGSGKGSLKIRNKAAFNLFRILSLSLISCHNSMNCVSLLANSGFFIEPLCILVTPFKPIL